MQVLSVDKYGEHIDGFKAGLERSFSFFYRLYYSELRYYSLKFVVKEAAAEDIVQESFVKIWERRKSFNHSAVIKAWLYTTVRNASLNYLEKLKREEKNKKEFCNHVDDTQHSIEIGIITIEKDIQARKIIEEVLPEECAKIFMLMFFENMTAREISEHLGLSISTVKNQKGRGLDLLRKANVGNYLESKIREAEEEKEETAKILASFEKCIRVMKKDRAYKIMAIVSGKTVEQIAEERKIKPEHVRDMITVALASVRKVFPYHSLRKREAPVEVKIKEFIASGEPYIEDVLRLLKLRQVDHRKPGQWEHRKFPDKISRKNRKTHDWDYVMNLLNEGNGVMKVARMLGTGKATIRNIKNKYYLRKSAA